MSAVYTVFLTIGLLISGVAVPLILTFQDNQKVVENDEQVILFNQPLLQTAMIFLGELACILVIHLATKKSKHTSFDNSFNDHNQFETSTTKWSWSHLWFILPSSCDLISITLLNLGLIYTTPSVYQMLKSSIIGFSAIFSSLFLARKFLRKEWISITAIFIGTSIIVTSSILIYQQHHEGEKFAYLGPVYLVVAQLFVAGQFILEEFLMDKFNLDPVKAMSIEGVFGTILISISLGLAYVFGQGDFDVKVGLDQVLKSSALWQSALLLALMVAIFNFFGLAVSVVVGVSGRSVLDTSRVVLTWVAAIYFGWDYFSWLELIGFTVLVYGIFAFNGVFTKSKPIGETTPLLS